MSNDLWLIQKSTVEGIGEATKEKLGVTEEIPVTEIESNIRAIPAQKPEQVKAIEVTANGTYKLVPDEGSVLTEVTVTEANPFQNKWTQLMNRTIEQVTRDDVVGLTEYSKYIFGHCYGLKSIVFPAEITAIRARAFYACTKLGTEGYLIFPNTIKLLEDYAFGGCTGLTQVSFRGTPDSISSTAFSTCSNLKHIYVPWSKGAVADSPWGASQATIHYNYGS